MSNKLLSLVCLLVLVYTGVSSAATITVCGSGCDETSITDALDSASVGDTV
jgi:hypothetical protein